MQGIMENLFGKYKCIKTYSKHMSGYKQGGILILDDDSTFFMSDAITEEPIIVYINGVIIFKLVDKEIYHRTDNITGEYMISTNKEYGEGLQYYYFYDYFISIPEHRKKVAKMINDL